MRIARALALAGIDSRRKCEKYITDGAVRINGIVIRDLTKQVDIENDDIQFRGRPLHFEKKIYFILNKPPGFTTTTDDPHAKKTVFDLLPRNLVYKSRRPESGKFRVFPVGRLDKNSQGLLFFTNDGELANHLTHPRYGVRKVYEVRLNRALESADSRRILDGVRLEEGIARVERIRSMSRRVVRLTLREGKKREIRRIFEKLNYKVLILCRIQFGPIYLGGLLPGRGRFLAPDEIKDLKEFSEKKR